MCCGCFLICRSDATTELIFLPVTISRMIRALTNRFTASVSVSALAIGYVIFPRLPAVYRKCFPRYSGACYRLRFFPLAIGLVFSHTCNRILTRQLLFLIPIDKYLQAFESIQRVFTLAWMACWRSLAHGLDRKHPRSVEPRQEW